MPLSTIQTYIPILMEEADMAGADLLIGSNTALFI